MPKVSEEDVDADIRAVMAKPASTENVIVIGEDVDLLILLTN